MYQKSLEDFIQGFKEPKLKIRLECYLRVESNFREKHPNAHFEVVTRTSKSVLAPSVQLLIDAGIYKKKDGSRNPRMPFSQYKPLFIQEMMRNEKAIERMKELIEIAKTRDVFLICACKNPLECHRSLIAKIMNKLYKNQIKE